MRYLQSGGFQNQPLMRLTLRFSLVLLSAFWISNLAMYFVHMNLDPGSVVSYYRGNEAEFRPARSAMSMLEVTHMHLPMFTLITLLLTHLMIFSPLKPRAKKTFIVVAFSSALLEEGASWMTRFWHPAFAWVKIAAFVVFQLTLLYLIVGLANFLRSSARVQGGQAAQIAARARPEVLGAAALTGEKVTLLGDSESHGPGLRTEP